MRIVVQKFGGTSVATAEAREKVVEKIAAAQEQGFQTVVVVSAMGRKGEPYATDTLIELAHSVCPGISAREMDQIMCCGEIISAVIMAGTLQAAGIDALMLTGGQAGIVTDHNFNNARIQKVEPSRLLYLLKTGKTPVVCGFQGTTTDDEFTTLGRGGSDTTASALGAALNAQMVEIYTDVDGIMTADPRIVNNAKILDMISYGEVCQLAQQGAKVIHPRAVEIAMQKNIPLIVKSTFSDMPGTLITNLSKEDTDGIYVADRVATGVTYMNHIAQIRVSLGDNVACDAAFKVFKAMSDHKISVDLINVLPDWVMFTIPQDLAETATKILEKNGFQVEAVLNCAKVSVVGGGMREVPGVMASFVEALAQHRIPIMQTVDSNASISVLVKQSDLAQAVTALHEQFGLASV
ncbi:aspartate kinase [Acetonema longum]|uniref:Aspartokinase n=1 Tax=Acetonema longum DSM 6540 TaxID=1009370 RepID=F7NPF5_9FIRM|nr:aspartate kinase [Acetonema longum]EGO62117.1 aspartate kinase I [Acetonema longum DSM 6540]